MLQMSYGLNNAAHSVRVKETCIMLDRMRGVNQNLLLLWLRDLYVALLHSIFRSLSGNKRYQIFR